MGQIFISYERDQNWRGEYILLFEKKIGKKKCLPIPRERWLEGANSNVHL